MVQFRCSVQQIHHSSACSSRMKKQGRGEAKPLVLLWHSGHCLSFKFPYTYGTVNYNFSNPVWGQWCLAVGVTRLPSGRSGVGIPTWATNFCRHKNVRTGSGAHPASCSLGTDVYFSDSRGPEREADHLHLAPRLRISGVVRLLRLWTSMARTGTLWNVVLGGVVGCTAAGNVAVGWHVCKLSDEAYGDLTGAIAESRLRCLKEQCVRCCAC
jgi:hypothetical protein